MRARRWFSRGLWLLVTVAVGVSFVGRPLAMRDAVLAAEQAAAHQAVGAQAHAMDMGDGHRGGSGMPCSRPDGKCCAPCLACCPGCASVPEPAAVAVAAPVAPPLRLAEAPAPAGTSPRPGSRSLQPPPIGPPAPSVG